MDYEKSAASLNPHQFELLVRAYIRQQSARLVDNHKDFSATLTCKVDRQGIIEQCSWTVCLGWGSDTKGEILHGAVTELMRREGWSRGSEATMRQIEERPE